MTPPDFLYKYQPLSAYSLAAVVNNTIWLAQPKTFNDPFDCAITLDQNRCGESVQHAIAVAIERGLIEDPERPGLFDERPEDAGAFNQFRENLRHLLQGLGVCSFSAVPDNLLMWSHYANQHSGICIEYDCREGTGLRDLAHPVRYSDDAPSISAGDLMGPVMEEAFDSLWLTKAACWSYEQEWRVLMTEGGKSYEAPSSITSIIFGARMPQSERDMVRYALRHSREIAFREAVLQEGRFLLDLRSI